MPPVIARGSGVGAMRVFTADEAAAPAPVLGRSRCPAALPGGAVLT